MYQQVVKIGATIANCVLGSMAVIGNGHQNSTSFLWDQNEMYVKTFLVQMLSSCLFVTLFFLPLSQTCIMNQIAIEASKCSAKFAQNSW